MYNIIHGNAPSYLNEMFKTNCQLDTHNTRNNKPLYLSKYNLVTEQRTTGHISDSYLFLELIKVTSIWSTLF